MSAHGTHRIYLVDVVNRIAHMYGEVCNRNCKRVVVSFVASALSIR